MIELKNTSKHYAQEVALRPTNLKIEAGITTVLIGPSGSGKSTILRLINGLLQPTTGHVEFERQRVSSHNVQALRRRMGYVIQDGGLFPHLTAEKNVTLMARHLEHSQAETRARLFALSDLTHFPKDALDRYPVELSGGQRQRVSLMRALMLDPDVLLLDEPLGALDPMVRASLQTELKEIFQSLGKTVLLVTHDMAEAAYLGNQIVVLKSGNIIQKGTLNDLREKPSDAFISKFVTSQRNSV